MYNTTSRMPSTFLNYKQYDSAMQRVRQSGDRDGEKMSPVNLSIENATPVQLPPLVWTNYHLTPACMAVRNSGFTVMITANYEDEMPYISSGPLTGNYIFSQVHFHWGGHDGTGSGHAVDGLRFPLEMHVVHLKRDCANLGEALQTKDGIAVMVHLFSLREERNTHLDQLTAILQFIQQPKCCARLYPTPLSEIVHPFTNDYFLYWGAVGSPKGRYRILWFVSRNVLPVSAQQLEEFRQLKDTEGNLLMANSSKPHNLGERSLFLVSPSERTNETMHDVPRKPGQRYEQVDDKDDTLEIRNAEYKSLAALDEAKENCRICPMPKRVKHVANINVGPYSKVNEGDTSVEESCVDLSNDTDDGLTVTTETNLRESSRNQKVVTNVNVTTCRHNYKADRQPSEVYQVISQRGPELHIKRKPVIVRQKDPSTEQTCMILDNQSATRTTCSAPSLGSTGGPLAVKQEHTNLANPPTSNYSSELAVTQGDSDYDQSRRKVQDGEYYYSESQNEIALMESTRQTKKVVTIRGLQDNDDYYGPKYVDNQNRLMQESPVVNNTTVPAQPRPNAWSEVQPHPTPEDHGGYYEEEKQYASHEEKKDHYLSVKQVKGDVPGNKVVGRGPAPNNANEKVPTNNFGTLENSNYNKTHPTVQRESVDRHDNRSAVEATGYKRVNERNGNMFTEMYEEEEEEVQEKKYQKKTVQKKSVNVKKSNNDFSYQITSKQICGEQQQNNTEQKYPPVQSLPKKESEQNNKEKPEGKCDPHYRVSLFVRTTVSDHRDQRKKKGGKTQKYYVTKISPVEKSIYVSPNSSNTNVGKCYEKKQTPNDIEHLYYAQPISDDKQLVSEDRNPNLTKTKYVNNQQLTSEYYESYLEESHKKRTEEGRVNVKTIRGNGRDDKSKAEPTYVTPLLPPPLTNQIPQDTGRTEEVYYNETLIDSEITDKRRQENVRVIHKQPQTLLSGNTNAKSLDNPLDEKKHLTQINTNDSNVERDQEKNLVQRVNVYSDQNDPNKNVYIIDKTVTGKLGQCDSTDVFVKAKHVEVIGPNKINLKRGVDYNLVKSKHPEPQYYVKEPPNKTQPSTLIRQHLSLDQQIKGKSQVRQSLEYQDNSGSKVTGGDPKEEPVTHVQQKDRAGISTIETYEESSQEQSSTVTKSHQQTFKTSNNTQGFTTLPNSNLRTLENNTDLENIQREKEDVLKFSALDPQSLIPSACEKLPIKNPGTERELIVSSNAPPTKTNINTSKSSYLIGPSNIINSVNNPKNEGVSSYEHEESQVNNHREYTKREKRVMFKNGRDLNSFHNDYLEQSPKMHLVPENKPLKEVPKNTPPITNQQLPDPTQLTTIDHDPVIQRSKSKIMERPSNGGVDFEEIVEENEVCSSQTRKEKTRTVQVRGDTSYKFPSQRPNVPNNQTSTHTISIKKAEIPEPHYITRVPKQPLVEYEAYPVDPHQPFEIITETYGETTSTVKTNKTFMMFKKINGKAVLNQPSVIEPMKISNNGKDASGSFISQKSNNVVPFRNSGQIIGKGGPQRVQPSDHVSEEYVSYENFTEEEKREYNKTNKIRAYNISNYELKKQEENIPELKETDDETDKHLQERQDYERQLVQSSHQPSTSKVPQGVTQYEYSETGLLSERKVVQKKKNIKYTSRRPSVNNNEDVEPDQTLRLEPGISPAICDDPQHRNKYLTDIWGSEKNKIKIVGALKPDISIPTSSENKEGPTGVVKLPNQIVKPDVQRDLNARPGVYSNEEYYESTATNHKHESTKQRYVAVRATILGGDIEQPGPSGHLRLDHSGAPESDQHKYPDIWDEPTKDLPVTGEQKKNQPDGEAHRKDSLRADLEKSKKSLTNKPDRGGSDPVLPGDKNNQSNSQYRTSNTSPFTQNDGNIVIYIRQPKSQKEQLSPQITVDVRQSNIMTSSELEAQRVQIHQVKKPSKKSKKSAGKPRIIPRKSKSAEYPSTFSSGTSESGVGSNAELDEERVIDMTHYNLTLKSHTEVELPHGQSARVKSQAEVKINPIGQNVHTASECSAVGDEEAPIETGAKGNGAGVLNQSPIKINTNTSVVRQYPSLHFSNQWDAEGYALLENNGKTLRVSYVDDSLPLPCVRGGPLEGDYIFGELHFHWGRKDCCGAEHIIDGHKGTIEGHFLYFKKEYNTAREALNHSDGIAILAVNLTVGGPPNPLLDELLAEIRLLREADTGAYVLARTIFAWIKPTIDSAKGYFSYKGSLTLEPYVEAVTWLIFPESIIFCCQQSCEFRQLKSLKGERLTKNFRLPQPLNDRPVYYVPIAVDV